ncbi:hypothetical protein [Microbacterium ulmi]|uniref:Uncharacterized protein n=1 Tax=Microbacterium ulmi TaxID=179095 RepID=A0A7Y2Q1J6_9MICO|nr:hypothetical protein [Microbacterium ulmi]NII69434.1 hypothetical protein [Microbacterium ulmi]NNH04392.1 hypothetical protein [Microbacterium ulmi]
MDDETAEGIEGEGTRRLGGLEALRALSWGARGWLFVVVAIGLVQLLRRQWGDAIIFGVTAFALTADASGLLPLEGSWRRPRTRTVVIVGVVAAVPLVLLPRHGVAMAIAVMAIGVAAGAAAWPRHPSPVRPWSRGLRALAIWWGAVWIAGCLWELAEVLRGAQLPGGRAAYPALSDLLNPAVDTVAGKIVFVVCWLAVGGFLVRRGGGR